MPDDLTSDPGDRGPRADAVALGSAYWSTRSAAPRVPSAPVPDPVKIAATVLGFMGRHGGEWIPRNMVRSAVRSWCRPLLTTVLDDLMDAGTLAVRTVVRSGSASVELRLVGGVPR